MKAFELTEEQRNDLYFKNFDGTIKIDGFVFSDYKGNTTMRISNTQEERPKRRTERTIEEHVKFINENNVERVDVFTESIEFLKECPGIINKHRICKLHFCFIIIKHFPGGHLLHLQCFSS